MINTKMEKALSEQINAEFFSAYLYLSMAAYFETKDLPGFANWMRIQYQEELTHAMKFFNYVHERDGHVLLTAIETPAHEWKSPIHVFEETLKHEQLVTSLINNLVDVAIELKDHTTNNFLQWFLEEQVEEEATASGFLAQLKMMSESKESLYMLDKEMGQRVFVDSTTGK